jgi:hypothetical protein
VDSTRWDYRSRSPPLVFSFFSAIDPGSTGARLAVLAVTLLTVGALTAEPAHVQGKAVAAASSSAIEQNGPCRDFRRDEGVSVCDFGVVPEQATRNVALVGDSHASHWRAALDVVAGQDGWRGLSITHTSCAFSMATKLTPEPARSVCVRWVNALPAYFTRHPEIDTMFVVGITGGKVRAPRGRTMFETEVDGYRNAWKALPATVEHIVVIRDTPKMTRRTAACIDRAVAAHRLAGTACAVPRRAALAADPQVAAARREGARHVQVVDLTRRLCDSRECFPVIDGLRVYKDVHHFTLPFSKALGPPLARAVDRLLRAW